MTPLQVGLSKQVLIQLNYFIIVVGQDIVSKEVLFVFNENLQAVMHKLNITSTHFIIVLPLTETALQASL